MVSTTVVRENDRRTFPLKFGGQQSERSLIARERRREMKNRLKGTLWDGKSLAPLHVAKVNRRDPRASRVRCSTVSVFVWVGRRRRRRRQYHRRGRAAPPEQRDRSASVRPGGCRTWWRERSRSGAGRGSAAEPVVTVTGGDGRRPDRWLPNCGGLDRSVGRARRHRHGYTDRDASRPQTSHASDGPSGRCRHRRAADRSVSPGCPPAASTTTRYRSRSGQRRPPGLHPAAVSRPSKRYVLGRVILGRVSVRSNRRTI